MVCIIACSNSEIPLPPPPPSPGRKKRNQALCSSELIIDTTTTKLNEITSDCINFGEFGTSSLSLSVNILREFNIIDNYTDIE